MNNSFDGSGWRWAMAGLSFMAVFSLQLLHADSVIQDGFSPVGENRTVGAGLSGTKTEQGGGTWQASSQFKFAGSTKDGWLTSSAASGSARVAIPPAATSVKIELDFLFESSETQRWVGVGIGGSDTDSTFYQEPTGILLCLDNKGSARLCVGSDAVNIGTLPVGLAQPGQFNHLTLVYNITANTVGAWINSTEICKEGTTSPVQIKADFSGLGSFGISPDAKIDNFKMTVTSGAAPAAKP
jgi:hypothetical protein